MLLLAPGPPHVCPPSTLRNNAVRSSCENVAGMDGSITTEKISPVCRRHSTRIARHRCSENPPPPTQPAIQCVSVRTDPRPIPRMNSVSPSLGATPTLPPSPLRKYPPGTSPRTGAVASETCRNAMVFSVGSVCVMAATYRRRRCFERFPSDQDGRSTSVAFRLAPPIFVKNCIRQSIPSGGVPCFTAMLPNGRIAFATGKNRIGGRMGRLLQTRCR